MVLKVTSSQLDVSVSTAEVHVRSQRCTPIIPSNGFSGVNWPERGSLFSLLHIWIVVKALCYKPEGRWFDT
jgi:hypothetical protein